MAQHTCNDADVRSVEECPACQADIADERLGILLVTVRVEIPVVFPFPADADESGTTWDDIRGRAVELVRSRLIPGFGMGGLALYSELVALTGPGSGGHYNGPRDAGVVGYKPMITETLEKPHLLARFPRKAVAK